MVLDMTSQQELRQFTGLTRPSAIKRFLLLRRIPFIVGADGWPRVLRPVLISMLGGKAEYPTEPTNEPRLRLRNG